MEHNNLRTKAERKDPVLTPDRIRFYTYQKPMQNFTGNVQQFTKASVMFKARLHKGIW